MASTRLAGCYRADFIWLPQLEKLGGAGMVETDYEHTSFIVWESRQEWLRIRLNKNIYAWTHRCHLESEGFKLVFVLWQEFLHRHADWLHFRTAVPHILRQSPGVESERVAVIGLDHKLVLLEIRGDSMEVMVEQPDLTCRGSGTGEGRILKHRGWVKWRDERGPWVYAYTRGC